VVDAMESVCPKRVRQVLFFPREPAVFVRQPHCLKSHSMVSNCGITFHSPCFPKMSRYPGR
jgi:hypothetical protein